MDRHAAGGERLAVRERVRHAVEPQQRDAVPAAAEPMWPSWRSPATIAVAGLRRGAIVATGTARVRAVPRCSMRDTTSWPT